MFSFAKEEFKGSMRKISEFSKRVSFQNVTKHLEIKFRLNLCLPNQC
jgi:hypothetical protein